MGGAPSPGEASPGTDNSVHTGGLRRNQGQGTQRGRMALAEVSACHSSQAREMGSFSPRQAPVTPKRHERPGAARQVRGVDLFTRRHAGV